LDKQVVTEYIYFKVTLMGEEVVESTVVTTTTPNVGKAKEAATQIQANIDMITYDITNTAVKTAQRLHTATVPDVTLVELFTEFVDLDAALADATIVALLLGGIFKDTTQDKQPVTPCVVLILTNKCIVFLV
jgi:hypothetical protein